MYKKLTLVIVSLIFLLIFNSATYAGLSFDYLLRIPFPGPYYQTNDQWKSVTYDSTSFKIGDKGCTLTTLANILTYFRLFYMPAPGTYDGYDIRYPTNPLYLNDWLKSHDGYDSLGNVKWLAIKDFYYYSSSYYKYIGPWGDCYPLSNKNNCFLVDWTPTVNGLIDNDLLQLRPDIIKISKDDSGSNIHFLIIAGYCLSKSDYIVYDPGKTIYTPEEKCDSADPQVNGKPTLEALYPNSKILRIYRFEVAPETIYHPTVGYLYWHILSPVKYQIINSQGLITGYDPVTGGKIEDIARANYYEESIDSINPEDPPSKPTDVLMIDNPPSDNYIIRLFGIGDGPYTLMMSGKSDNGTDIPDAPLITGTSYPGMIEAYRFQYSSDTGGSSLSTNNQPPVANAGVGQRVLPGETVTLDGSGSYDPDTDPLNYRWEVISRPTVSIAAISNPSAKTANFIPDIPGQYIIQLTVNDYFVNSISTDTITITGLVPIDIALKAFRAPSRMVLGDTKEVTVVVKNLSSIDASFNVTVEDITEGRIVGTATGIEGAGRGGTSVKISYIPTTTGEHILKATATVTNPDSADPNMIDNILTDITFVVISGGGGGGGGTIN